MLQHDLLYCGREIDSVFRQDNILRLCGCHPCYFPYILEWEVLFLDQAKLASFE